MWIWWIPSCLTRWLETRLYYSQLPWGWKHMETIEFQMLGKFHAFLRWKGHVYRQLFYLTNASASPNLLSRDGCWFQGEPQATPTQPTVNSDNPKMHVDLSHHCENAVSAKEKPSHSNKRSLTKEQLQGVPLTKQDILDAYSDVFTRIGKFPGPPYKFQLKPNVKPPRHAPRHIPAHLQEAFYQEQGSHFSALTKFQDFYTKFQV